MPPRLAAPVLTVDAGKMHQIDTRNHENLHSMWAVFNHCSEALEEGRRLENLSWRIWNRETFCCDNKTLDAAEIDSQRLRPMQNPVRDLPQLSTSVDSISSEDIESRLARSRQNMSPPMAIKRLSSSRSSLSGLAGSARERHISSFALERMVLSIKQRKNPKEALPAHVLDAIPTATASAPAAVISAPTQSTASKVQTPATVLSAEPITAADPFRRHDAARSSRSSDSTAPLSSASSRGSRRIDSDTSADSILLPQHSVVRGFTPGAPSSYRCSPKHTAPIPAKSMAADNGKKSMWMLGGGSKSSNEDDSSLDTRMSSSKIVPQKSSLTTQLKQQSSQPKTTSFRDIVETHAIADEDVFESSDEEDEEAIGDDDGDSDAIEEDDEDDNWEDSASESDDDDTKQPLFRRIDSRANLSSRRSLLTTGLHESDRAAAMQDAAARISSSRSQPQLQQHGRTHSPRGQPQPAGQLSQMHAEQRTAPKAIRMSPSSTAMALSPKTTRRNMLGHELTESLRMHLLHERAMKSQVNNASRKGIERRHTAQGNLSELQAFPRAGTRGAGRSLGAPEGDDEDEEDEVWENGVFGSAEYYERGW